MEAITLSGLPSDLGRRTDPSSVTIFSAFPSDFQEHTSKLAPSLISNILQEVIEQSGCLAVLPDVSCISQEKIGSIIIDLAGQFVRQQGGTPELAVVYILSTISCILNGTAVCDDPYRNRVLVFA